MREGGVFLDEIDIWGLVGEQLSIARGAKKMKKERERGDERDHGGA